MHCIAPCPEELAFLLCSQPALQTLICNWGYWARGAIMQCRGDDGPESQDGFSFLCLWWHQRSYWEVGLRTRFLALSPQQQDWVGTGDFALSPGVLPLLLKDEMWGQVVGLSKVLWFQSISRGSTYISESLFWAGKVPWERTLFVCQMMGARGSRGGWRGKGLGATGNTVWTETEPANRACPKPITEMSNREAATCFLLDRGCFPAFWGWRSCLGVFHSSGTACEGILSC